MGNIISRNLGRPENQVDTIQETVNQPGYRLNPLNNPLILNNILDFLSIKDLKASCLVERKWAKEGRKILINKNVVEFRRLMDIKKYLETNKTCGISRYIGFSIQRFVFSQMAINGILAEFLTLVGPQVEYLQLPITFNNWNLMFKYTMPNLSTLSLIVDDFGNENLLQTYVCLPQVKYIHLNFNSMREYTFAELRTVYGILDALPNILSVTAEKVENKTIIFKLFGIGKPWGAKLKYLNAIIVIKQEHIQRLIHSKIPVESLALELDETVETESLGCLLDTFSPTLSKLRLHFSRDASVNIPFIKKKMTNLRYLELRHYTGSLSVLINFPKLRELVLTGMKLDSGTPLVGLHYDKKVQHNTITNIKLVNCTDEASFIVGMQSFFPLGKVEALPCVP